MALQCARFYRSRMVRRVDSEVYELRDVIGPDEYHERVDNNAYTNEMARFTLRAALEAADVLKARAPAAYAALDAKIGFAAELACFAEAARRLKRQEWPDGLIPQFDGYFDLEDASIDAVRGRLQHEKEYWGGANGVAAHTQIIKQADVVTLLYMLGQHYDEQTVRANFGYYAPRTEHGSSLSACMHALVACRLGQLDTAYEFFMKSARADLVGGGKEWAGLVYIGGTHPAASGGAYMTLVNGFLGLTTVDGKPALRPRLPKGWRRVRCTLLVNGQPFAVDVQG
ncbi:MAG: glycoside hydrolase family 65 protein, partial [Oscillospiraceae bacterium]|jgi:kojibiose phosphorylase/nigerose phosphorylase|nr:glycoside hydrolase family 65 protein [Oscillospiraceae bacterium]